MRLVVEDVLGISECGRDNLQRWRTLRLLVPPADPLDGEPQWDEWCVLAALALDKIHPVVAELHHWRRFNAPLNGRVAVAREKYGTDLYVCRDGSIVHSEFHRRPAAAIHLLPEFEYAREELESRHGEAAF